MKNLSAILAAMMLCVLVGGCVSPDTETDLPWNTPEPWEASPMIPGMDRY